MIKRIKQKTCAAFYFAVMIIIASNTVEAQQQRVYDQAGLFSNQEVIQLEEKIDGLIAELQLDIVVVSTSDAEGKTSRAYADDFYDINGFGIGSEYDGLLYLIDMDNRKAYISTSGAAIDYFTDARIELILDHAEPYLINSDYYRSAVAFLDDVSKYVSSGVPEGQYRVDESEIGLMARLKRSLSFSPVYLLISMGIAAIIVGIMASRNRGTVKTSAVTYLDKNSTNLVHSEDKLINTHISQTKIHTPSSGGPGGASSAGSRSTTHRSGSGRTHGGGGRKF